MSQETSSADLVIRGRVFLGLAAGFAEALAIGGGRVLAAGSVDEVAGLVGPETRRIDLGGRVAIPGLNEAHMHHLPFGLSLSQVNLRAADGVRSL